MLEFHDWLALFLVIVTYSIPFLLYWCQILLCYATVNLVNKIYINDFSKGGGLSANKQPSQKGDSLASKFTNIEVGQYWSETKFMECLILSRKSYFTYSRYSKVLIPLSWWGYIWVVLWCTRIIAAFYVWYQRERYPETLFGFLITIPIITCAFECTWFTLFFKFRLINTAAVLCILYSVYFIALYGTRIAYSESDDAGIYTSIVEVVYCIYLCVLVCCTLKAQKYTKFMNHNAFDYQHIPPLTILEDLSVFENGRSKTLNTQGGSSSNGQSDVLGKKLQFYDHGMEAFMLALMGHWSHLPIASQTERIGWWTKVRV